MINFGNGIVAGGSTLDDVRIVDMTGVEYPTTEISVVEAGVVSGGTVGTPRATTRRMTFRLDFGRSTLTRNQIAAAFEPRASRVITGTRGSMPYVVDRFDFASPNLRGDIEAVVSIVSPDAYPVGSTRYLEAGSSTGGLVYPYVYPHTYDSYSDAGVAGFQSGADVDSHPTIRLTVAEPATGLDITISGRTLSLTGTYSVGNYIVITTSPTRTITLGGSSILSAFDKTSEWPLIVPGSNAFEASSRCTASIEWQPRLLGLV